VPTRRSGTPSHALRAYWLVSPTTVSTRSTALGAQWMNAQIDWRLRGGIASPGNFAVLLAVLLAFPIVLRWTGALSVAEIEPQSPQHTRAFLKFCFVLTTFLWTCFAIAFVGIRRREKITWQEVIGAKWNHWQAVVGDLGVAVGAFLTMVVIGNLSNAVLGPLQHDATAFRSMVAQNTTEALGFLVVALSAGFVEEFVFRGYIQRQCQALYGNTILASALQVLIFTQGHFYQGWVRLVPVLLIGTVLTIIALWRKSLIPGMIAHGVGDCLVSLMFFAKHL
jgi:CAAX protease family protein